jgi:hypothetical protein
MGRDNSSRRFDKFWWVVAFLAGIGAGAAMVTYAGAGATIWMIVGFGVPIAALTGLLQWFGTRGANGSRAGRSAWRKSVRRPVPPQHKPSRGKPSGGRGQLHAIEGRKNLDPPNSSAS